MEIKIMDLRKTQVFSFRQVHLQKRQMLFTLFKKLIMYIVVNHIISSPEDFWAAAQKNLPNLPEGGVQRVLNVFPNQTLDKATCVWEADSIENLDKYLREIVGSSSKETYFQINEAAAMGLND